MDKGHITKAGVLKKNEDLKKELAAAKLSYNNNQLELADTEREISRLLEKLDLTFDIFSPENSEIVFSKNELKRLELRKNVLIRENRDLRKKISTLSDENGRVSGANEDLANGDRPVYAPENFVDDFDNDFNQIDIGNLMPEQTPETDIKKPIETSDRSDETVYFGLHNSVSDFKLDDLFIPAGAVITISPEDEDDLKPAPPLSGDTTPDFAESDDGIDDAEAGDTADDVENDDAADYSEAGDDVDDFEAENFPTGGESDDFFWNEPYSDEPFYDQSFAEDETLDDSRLDDFEDEAFAGGRVADFKDETFAGELEGEIPINNIISAQDKIPVPDHAASEIDDVADKTTHKNNGVTDNAIREKDGADDDETTKYYLAAVCDKLDFCVRIIDLDPWRVKLELLNIIDKVNESKNN